MSALAPLLARQGRGRAKAATPPARTPHQAARADRYGYAASAAVYDTLPASAAVRGHADTAIPIPSLGGRAGGPAGGAATAAPVLDRPRRRVDGLGRPSTPSPLRVGQPPVRGNAPRAPFVILLLLLMGAGLMGLLLLNTALAQSAFKVHDLGQDSSDLMDEEQALSMRLDNLSDPANLAARAAQLGMVPGGIPYYLPAGAPLPPGARVIGAEPSSGFVVVVVPPPGRPAGGAVGPGATAGTGATTGSSATAGSGATAGTGSAQPAAAPAAGVPAGGAPAAVGGPAGDASTAGGSPAAGAR
ncbi:MULTISPECIES: hypothetical protein [Protofrankia]|uniref:Septum formation initiator n=1 Tax=Candidatus Protofrankia datiscae TaxID=2716812 RepID=F8AYC4_9ACTN|nr:MULTISPECIES: hypothetical protein [Protofrankia]AEH10427.1 hypothetical protein FsymDg_3118 [Candidatus Protofrankia datiscae]